MTKADIIEIISENVNITKKDIGIIIDQFFEKVKKGISANEHIELRGFGTFGTKERKARIARNPKTNEKINVPEHRVPYFKAGKELKALVTKK
ncbi:MAG: transcriptional regulator [bacterium]|nr:MAG: transcriptional regulator [bacterium]